MKDFRYFDSRVIYEMEGWVFEDLDTDQFTRATEARTVTETDLKFDEELLSNIINLDSWLHDSWAERMASEFDIGNGRTFEPDWNEVTVRLDLFRDEIIEGAEKRAAEDHTETAYVLAQWVYLAEKREHIPSCTELKMAYEEVAKRDDQPDDSTTDNYEGRE